MLLSSVSVNGFPCFALSYGIRIFWYFVGLAVILEACESRGTLSIDKH